VSPTLQWISLALVSVGVALYQFAPQCGRRPAPPLPEAPAESSAEYGAVGADAKTHTLEGPNPTSLEEPLLPATRADSHA
jgi:hypothetical protein